MLQAIAASTVLSSVFILLEDKNDILVHQPLLAGNAECLEDIMLITPAMIVTMIQKLKDNKSLGIDGIGRKLLKEIAEEISVPLAIILNLSLCEGTVPHERKTYNVVLAIGTRSAFFFNESRRTKVPKLYSKESMSSGTF